MELCPNLFQLCAALRKQCSGNKKYGWRIKYKIYDVILQHGLHVTLHGIVCQLLSQLQCKDIVSAGEEVDVGVWACCQVALRWATF